MSDLVSNSPGHPRRRRQPRVMVLWLPTLLIGTVTLLGLYHALFGVRRADVRRWRETLASAPVQKLPRALEGDLNLRFVPSFSARTIVNGSPLAPMAASTGAANIVSPNGYVFVSEDVRVAFGRSFVDPREQRPRDAIKVIARMADRLRQQGVHFIAVPVPAKSSLLPAELDDEYDAASRGPMLNKGHAAWIESLRAQGVEVFDPTDALWARRHEGSLFFTTDTHWTQQAMAVTAKALRPRVMEVVGREAATHELERRVIPLSLRGDVSSARADAEDLQGTLTQFLIAGRPAQFSNGPVLVMGDSYASIFTADGAGFAQVLAGETGMAVQSEAEFGVQAHRMPRQLADPAVLRDKKLVLLVFSLRKIQCNDWLDPAGGL